MSEGSEIKSVAIVGAGASGAVVAAALAAENYFERIRVFERRETAGGTWIYDSAGIPGLPIKPGALPPQTDLPLAPPADLPKELPANRQFRWDRTPIYDNLTTNVPHLVMSFSDTKFAYGPFVPHHIPRQYIENYFAIHKVDDTLVLNTTVEEILKLQSGSTGEKWKLTLRRRDDARDVDVWWAEEFDAVIIANGHYSVPIVPKVRGLDEYLQLFPDRVAHSKSYRNPNLYKNKRLLVIGNSSSGHDITEELRHSSVALPIYQSRRSPSRFDGDHPPDGVEWKPVVKEYRADGRIIFDDDTYLDDIDHVLYCTGYRPSFPFWNSAVNGGPLWSYEENRLLDCYQHTFFNEHPSLAIVGIPRTVTFRSFEYQAIAIARLFSSRNRHSLPPLVERRAWEKERLERTRKARQKYHDIPWDDGETIRYLTWFFEFAGLPTFKGEGRVIQPFGEEERWVLEHVRKYPLPGEDKGKNWERDIRPEMNIGEDGPWVMVRKSEGTSCDGFKGDSLAFV